MTITNIGDKVSAIASFGAGKINPLSFVWKARKIQVTQVAYTWKTKEGDGSVIHFSVTAGPTYYELSYNQKTLDWILEKTAVEG